MTDIELLQYVRKKIETRKARIARYTEGANSSDPEYRNASRQLLESAKRDLKVFEAAESTFAARVSG